MIEMVIKVVKDLLKSVLQCYEQTIIYLLYTSTTLDKDHYQIYFNTMNYRSILNEIGIYQTSTHIMNEPVNQLGHPILESAVILANRTL